MSCELHGMVAVLTLNRPEKLNALSNELLDALMSTLDRLELDRAVRSVVITGAGRAFSAGAAMAGERAVAAAGGVAATMGGVVGGRGEGRAVEEAAVAGFVRTHDPQEVVAALVGRRPPVFPAR